MKINKKNALKLWEEHYGNRWYAKDFHGNLMLRDAYDDTDCDRMNHFGLECYGWNLHHILPKKCGGTNAKSNLICTAIPTNEAASDKTTFWIEGCLYQVHKYEEGYEIERIG
ncbi:MAG: hypothetical protein K6E71_05080 [Lachnospiraceae bacterium]|nr:hypothetical protein [Lachnospiraceae bacterium]